MYLLLLFYHHLSAENIYDTMNILRWAIKLYAIVNIRGKSNFNYIGQYFKDNSTHGINLIKDYSLNDNLKFIYLQVNACRKNTPSTTPENINNLVIQTHYLIKILIFFA